MQKCSKIYIDFKVVVHFEEMSDKFSTFNTKLMEEYSQPTAAHTF